MKNPINDFDRDVMLNWIEFVKTNNLVFQNGLIFNGTVLLYVGLIETASIIYYSNSLFGFEYDI